MNAIIDKLSATRGVIGSALFDPAGNILAASLEPPYDAELLYDAHSAVLQVSENYSTNLADGSPRALLARYTFGYLLTRILNDAYLIVLANADANLAMLNVALNVATLKLSGRSVSGSISASQLAVPNGPARHEISKPLRTIEPAMEQRSGQPVERATMQYIFKIAISHFGTDAQQILSEELKRLGATPRTLDQSDFRDFVVAIADHHLEDTSRERFIHEAFGDH